MSKMNIMCLLLVSAVVLVSCPEQAAAIYDTGAGNCLSLPVIWAEGVAKELRSAEIMPLFAGETFTDELGVVWYLQHEEENIWQAESADWSSAPVDVTTIDWSDNLEAKDWTIKSIVRTEVVLHQTLDVPMTGYEMSHLWGEGITEMWGTNGVAYASNEATVYSVLARYTIQKLEVDPYDALGDPIDSGTLGLTWDAVDGMWTGPVGAMLYNSAVWDAEGVTGPDLASIYSSETNIPGKVIYGYNWNLRKMNDGVGYYRITFSLDAFGGKEVVIPCNTFFTDGVTTIMLPVEEVSEEAASAVMESDGGEEPVMGGVAVIDFTNNLTYIDLNITEKASGGGDSDLTAVILSTATAGNGNGPGYDEDSGPCRLPCPSLDDDEPYGICDLCGHCIPAEDGSGKVD